MAAIQRILVAATQASAGLLPDPKTDAHCRDQTGLNTPFRSLPTPTAVLGRVDLKVATAPASAIMTTRCYPRNALRPPRLNALITA
jgi:hypothetical protein